jgi:hypothetical protein
MNTNALRLLGRVVLFVALVGTLAANHPVAAQPQAQVACVTPPAGLVSWWPGEGDAQDIWDSNNGTLVNGAAFGPGMVGQAFSLDGVDDYVDVANSASLKPQQVTLEAWINPSHTGGNKTIVTKAGPVFSAQTGYTFRQRDLNNKFWFAVGTDGDEDFAESTTTFVAGQWYYLVGTYDGTQLRLFVNGVLETSTPSSRIINSDSPLTIGRSSSANEYFEGLVDEVSVYNRALTADEIAAIYNAGSAGKCTVLGTIFVASIDPSYTVSGGSFNITGSVTIHDTNGSPISNASVALKVTLPDRTQTAYRLTTDSSGVGSTSFFTRLTGKYTFTVTRVSLTGRTYDPSLNVETTDKLMVR